MSSAVRLHRSDVLIGRDMKGGQLRQRVLYIDVASARVVVVDIDDRNGDPEWRPLHEVISALAEGTVDVAESDPCSPDRRPDEYLSPRRRRDRDHWIGIIYPVVFGPDGDLDPAIFDLETRRGKIQEMCAAADTTPNVVKKWLRRWWRYGQEANALLSGFDRSGGRGKRKRVVSGLKRGRPKVYAVPDNPGLNVTESERVLLVKGGVRFHQRGGMSFEAAYQATKETFFVQSGKDGIEYRHGVAVRLLLPADRIPSFAQFRYWYGKERDRRAEFKARHGEKAALLRRDPKPGTFQGHVPGPGHTYIIDANIADIYLLSSVDPGRIIGRPVIYFVIDAFSLMIVGLYVGLEGPNWTGAKIALENAFCDKAEFLRTHGFDPEVDLWPCCGVCFAITADRGEVLARSSDHAVRAFELRITNCPAYRPDLKAILEGQFKLLNDRVLHWEPGAVYKARDRGDPDYRWDATYTIESITRLMILYVLRHNNVQALREWVPEGFPILEDGDPTPLDLWEWGMENHTGQLRRYHRDPEQDRAWIRINLMRESDATVSRDGIRLEGLQYWSDELAKEGWFDRAPSRRRPDKIKAAYEERDMGQAWVRLSNGCRVVALRLRDDDARYAAKTLHEVKDERFRRKLASQKGRHRESQNLVEIHAREAKIRQEAEAERETALEKRARPVLRGQGEARGRQRRADAARATGNAVPQPNSSDVVPGGVQGDVQVKPGPDTQPAQDPILYVPPPSDLDLL